MNRDSGRQKKVAPPSSSDQKLKKAHCQLFWKELILPNRCHSTLSVIWESSSSIIVIQSELLNSCLWQKINVLHKMSRIQELFWEIYHIIMHTFFYFLLLRVFTKSCLDVNFRWQFSVFGGRQVCQCSNKFAVQNPTRNETRYQNYSSSQTVGKN